LQLPGFDAARHTGFDIMHLTAGLVNDSVVGLLTLRRHKDWVRELEQTRNGNRFRTGDSFASSAADMARIQDALQNIVAAADSRIAGSRMLRLMHSSKKNKSHTMSVLASDYGERHGCVMGRADACRWHAH
jgi:hypothetical protein